MLKTRATEGALAYVEAPGHELHGALVAVEKGNPKTVTVHRVDDGHRYRVPYNLLVEKGVRDA